MALASRKKKAASSMSSSLLATNEEDFYLSRSRRLSATLRDAVNLHDTNPSSSTSHASVNTNVNAKENTSALWAAAAASNGRSAVHEWGKAGSVTVDRLAVSLHGGSNTSPSQSEKIQAVIHERRRSVMLPNINQSIARSPRYTHLLINHPLDFSSTHQPPS